MNKTRGKKREQRETDMQVIKRKGTEMNRKELEGNERKKNEEKRTEEKKR